MFGGMSRGSQSLLLIFLVAGCGIFSLAFSYLIAIMVWGKSGIISAEDISGMNLDFLRFTQISNQIGFFVIPPLIYALLTHTHPSAFTGLRKPAAGTIIAAVFLVVACGPFTGFLTSINEMLQLPASLSGINQWMRSSEADAAMLTDRFLNAPGAKTLIINLIMMGVLPALGEELLFRAALIGHLRLYFKNVHIPVLISAFLFSAMHLQFFGFLPRFFLGLVFGYIFIWSRSLWTPILAHFVNNSLIVIAAYLYTSGISSVHPSDFGNSSSPYWIVASGLAVGLLMLYIYKKQRSIA